MTSTDIITGQLKRNKSYHVDYADKTYGQLVKEASNDNKAADMKKLIEQQPRISQKLKGHGR